MVSWRKARKGETKEIVSGTGRWAGHVTQVLNKAYESEIRTLFGCYCQVVLNACTRNLRKEHRWCRSRDFRTVSRFFASQRSTQPRLAGVPSSTDLLSAQPARRGTKVGSGLTGP